MKKPIKIFSFFLFAILFTKSVFSQTLDSTFNIDGKKITSLGGAEMYTLTVEKNGDILATGFGDVVRYLPNGDMDRNFGSGGVAKSIFYTYNEVTQSDGKIVVSGDLPLGVDGNEIGLERFDSSGHLDNSFGSNGTVEMDPNRINGNASPRGLAISNDGGLILSARAYAFFGAGFDNLLLAKLTPDGALDTQFGDSGQVILSIDSASLAPVALIIQPDGKILVAGSISGETSSDALLCRFLPNGKLDSSFALNGIQVVSFSDSGSESASSLALQTDGKIIVAGSPDRFGNGKPFAFRCLVNGSLDSSFGINGKQTYEGWNAASAVAISSNGKIIFTGTGGTNPNLNFAITTCNANGSVDSSIGTVYTNFNGNYNDYGTCMAIQPDNKLLVGGYGNGDFELARYLPSIVLGVLNLTRLANQLLIFPNPIHSTETLLYSLTQDENLSLNLIDMNGRMVQSFFAHQKRSSGNHTEQLNFHSSLPKGNYELVISNGKNSEAIQLTKQ